MQDQAEGLRRRVAESRTATLTAPEPEPDAPRYLPAHRIALVGSKGGVGTSVLALNLALAWSAPGRRVALVDAAGRAADLEVLAGSGSVPRGLVLMSRPAGDALGDAPARYAAEVTELETETAPEVVLIDVGTGAETAADWAEVVDEVVVVTTPEPAARAGAYALIRRLAAGGMPIRLLMNRVRARSEGRAVQDAVSEACRGLLGVEVIPRGIIRTDRRILRSVLRQRPLLGPGRLAFGPAARDLRRVARTWRREARLRD